MKHFPYYILLFTMSDVSTLFLSKVECKGIQLDIRVVIN